jgi:hypothetical protein
LGIILPPKLAHLQTVFSEAHFNYLLGNQTSVAVMCSVLVEGALKDRAPGKATSHGDKKTLNHRIDEVRENGLLDDERIKCLRAIVQIGSDAAQQRMGTHDFQSTRMKT